MEGHTAYIYMLSVYPFQMELFSFSLYTKHTLLHGLILFVKHGKTVLVGPCHNGMARPQVADRGTASDKVGNCE